MDRLGGQFGNGSDADADDTFELGVEMEEGAGADETPVQDPPPEIGQDERRMQVRAYNHWAGLLGKRSFPSIEDLDPEAQSDFGPHSVLLDFTGGIENPAVPFLGARLAEECGTHEGIDTLDDVPSRSLLSRITDHYMQILANQAPIGFEAEFVNQRGATILYRGILLPFSSDDDTIDFIYGVINWKEMADQFTTDELLLEIDQALEADDAARNEGDESDADAADLDFDFRAAREAEAEAGGEADTGPLDETASGEDDGCGDDEAPAVDTPAAPARLFAIDAVRGEEAMDDWADGPGSTSGLDLPTPDFGSNFDGAALDGGFDGSYDDEYDGHEVGDDAGFPEPAFGSLTDALPARKREPLDLTPPAAGIGDDSDGAGEAAAFDPAPVPTEFEPERDEDNADAFETGQQEDAFQQAPHANPFETLAAMQADADDDEAPEGLYDCLAAARESAQAARATEDRSRTALYEAVGRAYDVSLSAAREPEEFASLIEENGLTVQDRAPMTPVVKLVFGAEYDKTRLTEYAAVLGHAHRVGVERGALAGFLRQAEGGLKGVVAAERRLRREESGKSVEPLDAPREALARKLRALDTRPLESLDSEGAEFGVVMIRRMPDGSVALLGEVEGEVKLVERVGRLLLG